MMSRFNWNKQNLSRKSCKHDEEQEKIRRIYDIELKKWQESQKEPYISWEEFKKQNSFDGKNISFGWIDIPENENIDIYENEKTKYSSHKFIENTEYGKTKISCAKCGYVLDLNMPMTNDCPKQ